MVKGGVEQSLTFFSFFRSFSTMTPLVPWPMDTLRLMALCSCTPKQCSHQDSALSSEMMEKLYSQVARRDYLELQTRVVSPKLPQFHDRRTRFTGTTGWAVFPNTFSPVLISDLSVFLLPFATVLLLIIDFRDFILGY